MSVPSVKYAIIDGNNLAFRCFYGVKALSNSQQLPVNAIYGFVNSLLALEQTVHYEHLIVCFDCSRSERRLQLLEEYKANRAATPEEFKIQLPYIKQIIPLIGGICCEKQGVEADDLIGSFCAKISNQEASAVIVSADKDLMQCVNAHVSQLIPSNQGWILLDRVGVFNKMQVYPEQIVDFLALMGDSADNYPGIQGVGPKTAAKWLFTYETLDNLLAQVDSITPERFRKTLHESKDLLYKNKALAQLDCNPIYAEEILTYVSHAQKNYTALIELLEQLNLNRLASKFKNKVDTFEQIELF